VGWILDGGKICKKRRILAVVLDIKANKCVLQNPKIHHYNFSVLTLASICQTEHYNRQVSFIILGGLRWSLGPAATTPDDEWEYGGMMTGMGKTK
jgi:hypothetical protein